MKAEKKKAEVQQVKDTLGTEAALGRREPLYT